MIAMLTAVVFLSFVGVGLIIPLFPFFGARVGAAPETITSAMAVFALGQLVATPFWGWASDRIGRKPVLIISLRLERRATRNSVPSAAPATGATS